VISITAIRTSRLRKQKLQLENIVQNKTQELSEKNQLLQVQTENLNEINQLLVDRQNQLERQSEELKDQSERLSQANAELQKLNATKDKLFSVIAHDLSAPFNSLLGFSDLLVNHYGSLDRDKIIEYLNLIRNSSETAYALLQNLLLWARSQTDRISYQPDNIRVKSLLEEILVLNKANLLAKKINVHTDCIDEVTVYADSTMLKTILRNLLNNAIKFTPQKGSIFLEVLPGKARVTISVRDTGTGMKKEMIEKILSEDTVHSEQGTQGEQGSGLGLILCKEFLRINSSKLEISSAEGKGSTFSFSLDRTSGQDGSAGG
jgi:signal transduction histidine kinase